MPDGRSARVKRRTRSVGFVAGSAVAVTVTAPLWIPVAAMVDIVRLRWRLPLIRLLAFGVVWLWLEVVGVAWAAWLWLTGRRSNLGAHYRLQHWWVVTLMATLRATTGITVRADGAEALRPGPVIMMCRHTSLADSIISAWVVTELAGMQPHYVLKQELLKVPNLDIVGNRLPNVFILRGAPDSQAELGRLRAASARLGEHDVMVIFPEGTRASDAKRSQRMARLDDLDPARADRLHTLRHLIPPRPDGIASLLEGNAAPDVVIASHVGLDGLDRFPSILRHIARRPPPVRFELRRIQRADVPSGEAFSRWLDDRWVELDDQVNRQLQEST